MAYVFKNPLLLILLVVLPISTVSAQGLRYFVGTSLKYSDNIVKEFHPQSGEEYSLDTGISGVKKGALIETGGDARLSFYSREKELFDNAEEVSGDGVLFLNFTVLPQTIVWNNSISSSRVLLDSRQSTNADNLSDQVSYQTQPEWKIRLSPVDQLLLSAAYNYIQREDLNNSKRLSGTLSWKHQINSGEFSANHVYEDIDNGLLTPGYRIEEFFFAYSSNFRLLNFNFSIGEQRIELDGFDSDDETLSLRASAYWKPLKDSRIRASYSLGYEDDISQLSKAFRLKTEDIKASETVTESVLTSNIINTISETKTFSIDYEQKFNVNTLKIQYAEVKQDDFSQVVAVNNDETAGRITFSRQLNPLMRFIFKEHYIEKLFQQGEITREYFTAMQLNWSLSKHLRVIFDIIHEDQSSDFKTAEFEAVSGLVSLRYTGIL